MQRCCMNTVCQFDSHSDIIRITLYTLLGLHFMYRITKYFRKTWLIYSSFTLNVYVLNSYGHLDLTLFNYFYEPQCITRYGADIAVDFHLNACFLYHLSATHLRIISSYLLNFADY